MGGAQDHDSRGGVIGRVRDVADGLGQLVGQHFKLARLELVSDLKSMGQRVRAVAILTVLAIIGYTLAMAGVAVVVGGNQAIGLPLLLIGGGHVVVRRGRHPVHHAPAHQPAARHLGRTDGTKPEQPAPRDRARSARHQRRAARCGRYVQSAAEPVVQATARGAPSGAGKWPLKTTTPPWSPAATDPALEGARAAIARARDEVAAVGAGAAA